MRTVWAPRPEALARFGVNVSLENVEQIQAAADLGAVLVRGGGGWQNTENYDTGVLTTPTKAKAGLTLAGQLGLSVILVSGYEPPVAKAGTCTLTAPAKVGDRTLQVTGAPVWSVGRDCVAGKVSLSPKENYAGMYVTGATFGAVTVSAPLTVALPVGTVLTVNRWKYPPINGTNPSQASVQAFIRVMRFHVEDALRLGVKTAYAGLWNEWEWPESHWGNIIRAFQQGEIPAGVTDNLMMQAILLAALQSPRLPAGAHWNNGATDKSGALSILKQFGMPAWLTKPMVDGWIEGAHLYGNNPEHGAQNDAWELLNQEDASGNLSKMIHHLHTMREQGWNVRAMATECGGGSQDDTVQADYNLRRILSLWPSEVMPVIFQMGGKGDMDLMSTAADGSLQPRLAYTAMQRLHAVIAGLGGPGGSPAHAPVVTALSRDVPFMSSAYYGAKGAVLFCCQRDSGPNDAKRGSGERWAELPRPAPVEVTVTGGVRAVDLTSGAAVPLTGGSFPVSRSPVAVFAS